jgi:HTH-type transcriptional regulator/antitoxin HigA
VETTAIKSRRDYRRALAEIEGLMNAKRDTPEGRRLDALATLVEAWEAKRYPLGAGGAATARRRRMDP